MNRRAMPRLAALFLSLALLACSPEAEEAPPLAGAAIGGEFNLIDESGKPRTWADFRGKYAMVYFGYTYCPDVCPTDMQRAAQGLREFANAEPELAEKVQHIFVTVDPERDTPEVVGEFTDAFGKDIVGLTGSREQVDAAAKAFKVFHGKGKVEDGGAYLVDHSSVTYLFDRAGEPLATLPADQGASAVAAELAKWVR